MENETLRLFLALGGGVLLGYLLGYFLSHLNKDIVKRAQTNTIRHMMMELKNKNEIIGKQHTNLSNQETIIKTQRQLIDRQKRALRTYRNAWYGLVQWLSKKGIDVVDDAGVDSWDEEGGEDNRPIDEEPK